jgi:hypothetical protein
VIDTYTKVAFAKLYDRKTPITAAEILNDRVVPFYDEHGIRLSRVLTDRGTEFCGTQSHDTSSISRLRTSITAAETALLRLLPAWRIGRRCSRWIGRPRVVV